MTTEQTTALLAQFKLTIGDFGGTTDLDGYYTNFLNIAIADLEKDDISTTQLESTLGSALIILYAEAIMNNADISSNTTINLLRVKLAILTKGERVAYTLTISETNCTVLVKYYNETILDGTEIWLAQNLEITATADSGYTMSSLNIDGADYVKEDFYKVTGDVTITALAVAN